MDFGFDTYLSPFTTRYGSREMRQLHSQLEYYAISRAVLAALARAQSEFGLVSQEELADIEAHKGKDHVDPEEIRRLDRKIHHDFMAHVKAYAAQCETGGAVRIFAKYGLEARTVSMLTYAVNGRTGVELAGIRASTGGNVYFPGR